MKSDKPHDDPAFPAMTLDILNNMLSRSDSPARLAGYVNEEIRELTGARCVLLIQCLETDHTLIDVTPRRLSQWAQSEPAQQLYTMVHDMEDVQLWHMATHPEIAPLMPGSGFEVSIVIPLRLGSVSVGAMLLLGLPDEQHIKAVISLLETLSKVLALMLRNALLYESQEKAIEERTKELKFYGFTMENMVDPVFWINADASFQKINASACKMLGYSDRELSGLHLTDVIPELSMENWAQHWEELKQAHGIKFETVFLTRDGHKVPVDVSANYIEFDNKAYNCIIARELTDKKQMESRLRQAQKMEAIGTLAGGIAHDFNNILFPIIGFSEMLKEDIPDGRPEREYVNEIHQASLRAKDLVNQILTFSRQRDQELLPVKLQPIVKEALKLLRSSIPKTIDIQKSIDADCGVVVADPTQIHQIVMNLATNAFHAMEDTGGILKVSLNQTRIGFTPIGFSELAAGSYAVIKVVDTGIGIEKENLSKVFDPYFSTKEKGKGTGLGLSVVQGIVKNFKGDIRLYSEPGRGTEVSVYLPIMKKAKREETSDILPPIPTGSEKILLVDDEPAIVNMEHQMLERMGYHVTSKTSSAEALQLFKADPNGFHLVISDMTMPEMTGLQLVREMRRIREDIPVIIFTGFSDLINENTFKAAGIQSYAAKPVIKRDIARKIREVLDGPR